MQIHARHYVRKWFYVEREEDETRRGSEQCGSRRCCRAATTNRGRVAGRGQSTSMSVELPGPTCDGGWLRVVFSTERVASSQPPAQRPPLRVSANAHTITQRRARLSATPHALLSAPLPANRSGQPAAGLRVDAPSCEALPISSGHSLLPRPQTLGSLLSRRPPSRSPIRGTDAPDWRQTPRPCPHAIPDHCLNAQNKLATRASASTRARRRCVNYSLPAAMSRQPNRATTCPL